MNFLFIVILLISGTPASSSQSFWPLWTTYSNHFVKADGRVVDHDRRDMTTSEGQSYAMFFSLVANDRSCFDRLYRWTSDNLAEGRLDRQLPAWSWGTRGDGTQGIMDANSASDGDIWIAFDLIQAGRLWKRADYTAAGQGLLSLIAQKEVTRVHGVFALLPGQSGFEHKGTVVLNPSYMPLFVLRSAARSQPAGPWSQIAGSLPALLRGASIDGFAPDWLQITADGTITPAAAPDKPGTPATGSYDAIRIYLWSGLTAAGTPGRDAVLKQLASMVIYAAAHPLPPEFIIDRQMLEGQMHGKTADAEAAKTDGLLDVKGSGPLSYSAALIPFLEATHAFVAAGEQEKRLNGAWSSSSGSYGDPPHYYDQNLAMFAVGFTEHRYRINSNGELETPWQR
jgi:endoglucanase